MNKILKVAILALLISCLALTVGCGKNKKSPSKVEGGESFNVGMPEDSITVNSDGTVNEDTIEADEIPLPPGEGNKKPSGSTGNDSSDTSNSGSSASGKDNKDDKDNKDNKDNNGSSSSTQSSTTSSQGSSQVSSSQGGTTSKENNGDDSIGGVKDTDTGYDENLGWFN